MAAACACSGDDTAAELLCACSGLQLLYLLI